MIHGLTYIFNNTLITRRNDERRQISAEETHFMIRPAGYTLSEHKRN
jgi:hypothetical protein